MIIGEEMQAQYNKAVNDWGKATATKLIFAVAKLNLRDRVRKDGAKSLKESIKFSVKKNSGDAEAIIFGTIIMDTSWTED
jgi:hypothetical protein